ncbi:hypothetical protein LTS10_006067 [Elasticomyces elasticus]|nr:hypothetical protein LTS10_006067 [Elasticomyces elasticus]
MADQIDPRTPLNPDFTAEYEELSALHDAAVTEEEHTTLAHRLDAALTNPALPPFYRATYEVTRACTSETAADNIHRAECLIQYMREKAEAEGHQPKKVQDGLQNLIDMVAQVKEQLEAEGGQSEEEEEVVAESAPTEDESGGAEGTGEQGQLDEDETEKQ